jgi:hypothetical protein
MVEAYINSETAPAEVKERKGKTVRIAALGKLKAYWMDSLFPVLSIKIVVYQKIWLRLWRVVDEQTSY